MYVSEQCDKSVTRSVRSRISLLMSGANLFVTGRERNSRPSQSSISGVLSESVTHVKCQVGMEMSRRFIKSIWRHITPYKCSF